MSYIGPVLFLLLLYAFSRRGAASSSSPAQTTSAPANTNRTPKQKTVRSPGGDGSNGGWACIAHPDRLQQSGEVTVTGTVLAPGGQGPHFAPDGDLVFSFKLDSQFQNLVNSKNNGSKYGGGIWCEGVCQKANKDTEAKHKGDCANCTPKKFFTPKVGQKLRISGTHVIDNGEDGHAEIHPISSMEAIS